jgi:hypothetical protein
MRLSKDEKERKIFDIHSSKRHNVVNLKPRFRFRHPLVWASVLLVFILLVSFGIRQVFTRAAVQDFVPTTCLGNWQNVTNAEGNPETLNSPDPIFSSANSAVYASGTEIYCGGFIPPTFATSGQITNVGLTLVWQIGDESTSSSINVASTSEDEITTSTLATTSADDVPTSTIVIPSTTSDGSATTSIDDVPTSTMLTPTATSDEATTTNVSIPTPVDTSTDEASTTVPVPAAAPTTTQDASSTSFIRQLIPFALADDTTSTVASSSTDATTTVVMPPPAPDENFLDVSYSTDGQTWISIGEVNSNNWQNFTVTLPIADWTDLQNLQVRIEGIPTTQDPVPPIYLDGMFMEVHYDVAPPLTPPDVASSTDTTAPSTSTQMTLVTPGAQQTCQVEPFSQELPLGGTATYTVELSPSINGISYSLLLGDLPAGISAQFGDPSGSVAATSSLVLQAQTSTIPGSLNIAVIYQENEEDGSAVSNFCQLNIDVK